VRNGSSFFQPLSQEPILHTVKGPNPPTVAPPRTLTLLPSPSPCPN
jgi:hypothetical protein